MSVVCVVAVRMGSSRLPGKALCEIDGKPLIEHLLDRLSTCSRLDQTVIATTDLVEDDLVVNYCKNYGVACFRGSPTDVLSRITSACKVHDARVGVVVYGDGPLIDPQIIDYAIEQYLSLDSVDFVGNDLVSSFPAGMEVEVFSMAALGRCNLLCKDKNIREHGTLYLRQNPQLFRIESFEAEDQLRRPDLVLEVDAPEDLAVIGPIAKHMRAIDSYSLDEIIKFVDANSLQELNEHIPRRWKEFRQSSVV
jgi:spore coat polysaccharide biosynthesis protein SpsF